MTPSVGDTPPARELRVHLVVYGNEPAAIARRLEFLRMSASHAVDEGTVASVEVAIGDCSPEPVADSVSDFAKPELIEALNLTYDFFDANLGSGGGNNALWDLADVKPPLVLVLNPDTVVSPRLLAEMASALQADSTIGAADARQIPMEHPKHYDPATLDCSWVSGACMMVRGDVYSDLEGFAAEHFPLYCDDVDFSWRVRLAGYRCVHLPQAVVHHDKRPAPDGRPHASEAERYWAVLAGLLMATRWGRPDLADDLERHVREAGDPVQARALEEFDTRRRDGRLPLPIQGADTVAQFIDGNYAEHRF